MSVSFDHQAKVGQDIVCWCTRCKMDLAHIVVAKTNQMVHRVQCKTCKSLHNYYPARQKNNDKPQSVTRTIKKKLNGEIVSITPIKNTIPKKSSETSKAPSVKSKAIAASKQAFSYQNALQNTAHTKTYDYSPKLKFQEGQIINHPQFGMGVVLKVLSALKVEVIFQDEVKLLVHGLK